MRDYAITGSLALRRSKRAPNDIDLVVAGFEKLPRTLSEEFLCIHAHPKAESGKLLLQLVAPDEPIRIDIFSAAGQTLRRATLGAIGERTVSIVSTEDLAARLARTLLGLSRGDTVPRKFADDFRTIIDDIDPGSIQTAWQDHRPADGSESFDEACNQLAMLLALHDDLLIEQAYSRDVDAVCERCEAQSEFPIASRRRILEILGYC